jgi:hypothetical protein
VLLSRQGCANAHDVNSLRDGSPLSLSKGRESYCVLLNVSSTSDFMAVYIEMKLFVILEVSISLCTHCDQS